MPASTGAAGSTAATAATLRLRPSPRTLRDIGDATIASHTAVAAGTEREQGAKETAGRAQLARAVHGDGDQHRRQALMVCACLFLQRDANSFPYRMALAC